jgi:Spy/CpxP family protein refolding chaperone
VLTLVKFPLLVATVAFGGVLLAEAPRVGGNAAERKPADSTDRRADRERLRDQLFDQMRAERMWKLTDALKLDEASAAKVFPLLSKYDEQERTLGRERLQAFRDLRDASEAPTPDAARIDALVDKLLALRGRRHALESEKTTALRKVLTPVQMAKMMMLAPRLDDGFRQRIHEAIDGTHDDLPPAAHRP